MGRRSAPISLLSPFKTWPWRKIYTPLRTSAVVEYPTQVYVSEEHNLSNSPLIAKPHSRVLRPRHLSCEKQARKWGLQGKGIGAGVASFALYTSRRNPIRLAEKTMHRLLFQWPLMELSPLLTNSTKGAYILFLGTNESYPLDIHSVGPAK